MFGFLAPYRLYAYLALAVALLAGLWWFVHEWNAGRDALRELPQVQEQIKAERETAKLLMTETKRLADTDAQRRGEMAERLDGIGNQLAELAKRPGSKIVEYHYETVDGQKCAVALLGADFLSVYNQAADIANPSSGAADGSDEPVR